MSLPDTVFIFVLALIIFGPKKLPEIGRQIGRLVGEFRRASNEFKFQIEEELRQVDLTEKRSERQTIAAPLEKSEDPITPLTETTVADSLPIGQHPNIDNFDASDLKSGGFDSESNDVPAHAGSDAAISESDRPLNVTAAAGSEPRATVPFANGQSGFLSSVHEEISDGNGRSDRIHFPSAKEPQEAPKAAEPATPEPAVTHADVGHG